MMIFPSDGMAGVEENAVVLIVFFTTFARACRLLLLTGLQAYSAELRACEPTLLGLQNSTVRREEKEGGSC